MLTVLVVDDDEAFAQGVADALRARRHRVLIENDGDSALLAIAGEHVDVTVCDIVMPGLLGPGFMLKAQSLPGQEDMPIIFMSTLPESRVSKMFDGYAAYLQKPFSIPQLLAALERVVATGAGRAPPDASGPVPVFRVR